MPDEDLAHLFKVEEAEVDECQQRANMFSDFFFARA
jgi:hypothetical protein